MKAAKEKSKDQDQDGDQLKRQIKNLSCELLKERITRIDFQVHLLSQWRQQSQQELNHLLGSEKNSQSPKG
ncbi:MAG: hypothetical protein AB1424_05840 [Thermodesulfobacteriota bacterium]